MYLLIYMLDMCAEMQAGVHVEFRHCCPRSNNLQYTFFSSHSPNCRSVSFPFVLVFHCYTYIYLTR